MNYSIDVLLSAVALLLFALGPVVGDHPAYAYYGGHYGGGYYHHWWHHYWWHPWWHYHW